MFPIPSPTIYLEVDKLRGKGRDKTVEASRWRASRNCKGVREHGLVYMPTFSLTLMVSTSTPFPSYTPKRGAEIYW